MMKDSVYKLKKAYEKYQLDSSYKITENLLQYIRERISANQKEIKELIKIKNEKCTYEQIEKVIQKEAEEDLQYKDYKRMYINEDKFIQTRLLMPIGTIAVESFDTIEVIKYFIKAIKTRNGIAISDMEYDEQSVKFLILEIFKEAMKKFNIDDNLIMILPYEECFYEYFDKVIYTYDEKGNTLEENRYDEKEKSNKKYVYVENLQMEEIAKKDNGNAEILYGDIDNAIEKINTVYSKGASIYTDNSKDAYKFINLVHSENVMVNTSLENAIENIKSPNEMYEYKNIILPIPRKIISEVKAEVEKTNTEKENELSLIKINGNIFEKIRGFFKKIFGK